MEEIMYIIGQILGGVSILLGFLSFQMRTQKGLILMQTATAISFCAHYLLIGAITGMALNVIATVRNIIYYYRNQRGSKELISPIVFSVIMLAAVILTWEAWYSILVLMGLVLNTLAMSFSNPQRVRASILVTSPMVLAYDVFVLSVGGIIYESVAISSACIGIFRTKRRENKGDKK